MSQTKKLNMKMSRTATFVITVLKAMAVIQIVKGLEAPHCSSTFHVWQPGQEAQQMIRDMYLKMDNLTSYTQFQISEMRARVIQEVSRIQNWTYAVDKRVFQIQIDKMDEELLQMKFSAGSSKVQMQMELVSRRVDDLERTMYSIRSKLRSGRSNSDVAEESEGHHYNKHQQKLSSDMAATLKNRSRTKRFSVSSRRSKKQQ